MGRGYLPTKSMSAFEKIDGGRGSALFEWFHTQSRHLSATGHLYEQRFQSLGLGPIIGDSRDY